VGLEQIVEREHVGEEEEHHRRREYGHRPLHHHSLRTWSSTAAFTRDDDLRYALSAPNCGA
jgi:hypothetical protein